VQLDAHELLNTDWSALLVLTKLKSLDLSDINPQPLPVQVCELASLQRLDLRGCSALTQLPESFGKLGALRQLNLKDCSALTQLPESFGSLGALQKLDLSKCTALTQLPESFGKLGALRQLDLSYCIALTQLPESFGSLGALVQLNLIGCRALTQLPKSFGSLGALQRLRLDDCPALTQLCEAFGGLEELKELCCRGCHALTHLPESFGSLGALDQLNLTDCHALTQLPESFGSLGALVQLDLWDCQALTQLPESFGSLGALRQLDLSGCQVLSELPESFGNLGALMQLYLSRCTALRRLPSTFNHLTALDAFHYHACPAVEDLLISVSGNKASCLRLCWWRSAYDAPFYAFLNCHQLLQILLKEQEALQLKQAAVNKLATQQETMLTTLERMSWLVVLLATATFIAFLQPPGGLVDEQVMVSNLAMCYTAVDPPITGITPFMQCAALLFFVLDGLSFGLSMGCLVMIVTLSMPRIRWADENAEAGRFYMLLVLTWGLLYLAVSSGFAAFIASGLAVHKQVKFVIGPIVPGMLLVLIGAGMMMRRFASLFPGWDAIKAACSFQQHALAPFESDVELGQQRFWQDYLQNGRVLAQQSRPSTGPENAALQAGVAGAEAAPLLPVRPSPDRLQRAQSSA